MLKFILTVDNKRIRVKIRDNIALPVAILEDIKTIDDLKFYKKLGFITYKEIKHEHNT